MRGQNTIIRMRMEGLKPRFVWVFVLQNPCEKSFCMDAENVVPNGGQAEIHIGSDEIAGTLDFRVLNDLAVLLQGADRDRLRLIFARIKEFNPARIITSSADFVNDYTPAEVAE